MGTHAARFPIRRRASASPSLCTASSRSLVKPATSSLFASYARTSRASSHFRYSARLSRSARFRRVAAAVAVSSSERVVASCVVVVEHLETRRRLLRECLPSLRGGLRVRQKSSARGFLPTALACLACLLPPERVVRVLRGAAAGRVGFSEAAPEVFRRVGSDVGAAVVHVVGRQTHEPVLADPESGHVQSLVQRLACDVMSRVRVGVRVSLRHLSDGTDRRGLSSVPLEGIDRIFARVVVLS